MPPFSANNVVEIEYVDTIIVDQVANVTAVIDPSITYITKKYADENYLVSSRLAEILGLEFGGNIQDIGNKTKGKFYYDSVTKFYYECIEDNSLTYNDSGKFRAISNKPLSDKVENLFKFGKDWVSFPNGLKIQWGLSIAQNGDDIVRLISPFKSSDYQVVACDSGGGTYITGMTPLTNETFKACGRDPYTLAYKSFGFRWVAIGY